jgi:DNA-binding NtrC family response regulator
MMTAYPREMGGLLEEALDNNAYAYLDKPLDMEKVLKLVEEISEKRIQKKR